ncbi:MAG: GPI anchored serine-threonine rich family protein [Thermoanaerobaculia bacterium]
MSISAGGYHSLAISKSGQSGCVINLTYPDGGEVLYKGQTYNITWTKNDFCNSEVKIELYKGGSYNSTISSSTSNDGSYSWTIPSNQTTGSDYKIKIIDLENSNYYDYSNDNFTITEGGGGGNCTGTPVFITASAHSEGANQTKWRTDLSIFNPNNSEASISMKFLTAGQDNTNSECIFAGNISGRSSIQFNDIVLSLFSKNPGVGGIAIYSTLSGTNVMSRTYNQSQSGTYGQAIPGRQESYGIATGKTGILIQLHQNSDYRTNIGFLNITSSQAELRVNLYDENGNNLGTLNYSLKPYEQFQENQIFKKVTSDNVKNGRVEITVLSGKVLAYGSVVDNLSGDPSYIEPFIK